MKKFSKRWAVVGTLLGTMAGFVYWWKVGCLTGHCPIQSHWQTMTIWGGAMGFLSTDLFVQFTKSIRKT